MSTKNSDHRKRRWISFFVVLGLLAASAAAVEMWFNLKQQVTVAAVNAAEERWRAKGPSNYNLEYVFKTLNNTDQYKVQVRSKQVISARRNDLPLEPARYRYCSMPYLFEIVEDFLREDSKEGAPRTFSVATFDPVDGHLVHYVRSVMPTAWPRDGDVPSSKRERQEITVSFHVLGDS
jgi:hypothetical protein